jgi:AcrR family transcriptional regulator
MDGLTVREVAKAAGVSTGVVSHYFSDKRELLQATYNATADEVYGRVAQLVRNGAEPVQCLLGFLPLDAERQRDWRVWFAYWGLAIGDREFAIDQKRRARRARQLVAKILASHRSARRRQGSVGLNGQAAMLLGLIQGIAAQAVFDPHAWPAAKQARVFAEAWASIC